MGGGNHLSMSRLNLKSKIFSELLVSSLKGMWVILSCPKLNLKFKIFSEILVGDNGGGLIIFPWPHFILNLKFSVRFWLVTMRGVNHLSMSRLNLKSKIFSELLVSNTWGGVNHLSCPGWILNIKFSVSYWSAILGGVNHLSCLGWILNLKFSASYWSAVSRGCESSFHVPS